MGSDINTKKGFTIIELSLSIVFIAILSITIVLIINNTVSSYRRGIMLNQINTTGMDLVDDMRLAVQNSSTDFVEEACEKAYASYGSTLRTKCVEGKAKYFVSLTKTATVRLKGNVIGDNIPVFGAFCAGSFSYIWNSGYLMNTINSDYRAEGVTAVGFKYRDESGAVKELLGFRLLKVPDATRSVCISATNGALRSTSSYSINNSLIAASGFFDISDASYGVLDGEPVELLSSSSNGNMILYDLTASTADNDSNNALFYSVSFILGTIQGGVNIKKASNSCASPNDYSVENFDYCSINKFNFAAQANGA